MLFIIDQLTPLKLAKSEKKNELKLFKFDSSKYKIKLKTC